MTENPSNKNRFKKLDKTTLALANANVELLAAQEELEAKNNQLMQLLDELENSKDELQAILDSSNSAIVMVNPLGNITAGNQLVSKYFPISYDKVLGLPFQEFIDLIKNQFAEPDKFVTQIIKLKKQPDNYCFDDLNAHEHYSKALKTKPPFNNNISLVSQTVTNKDQTRTLGRVWIFFDITAIIAADEKLRAIVEASPVPFTISSIETGRLLYVNKALAELAGLSEKALLKKSTLDFYYTVQDRNYILQELAKNGHLNNHELRFKKADGSFIWMILSVVQSVINNEPVFISSLYNIDERRKAEEALQQERNFISAVLDTAPALILVLDSKGNIVRMNRSSELHSGKKADEIKGKKLWQLFRIKEESEYVKKEFKELISGNKTDTIECYWTSDAGEKRLFTWSTSVLDESEKMGHIIVIGTDITVRKTAEIKLSLYREIFLNSKDAIAVVSTQGDIIERNPAHRKHTGYSDKEIKNMKAFDFIDNCCKDMINQSISKTDSFRGESKTFSKKGKQIDVDLSIFPIKNETGKPICYVGTSRDITERKKAEAALQKAKDELEIRVQQRTRQLEKANRSLIDEINERKNAQEAYAISANQVQAFLEAIPDLIFRLSKNGIYLDYHAPKNSSLAIPREAVIGKHITDTMPPELKQVAEKTIARALKTGEIQVWEYQLAHNNKICDFEARVVVSGKDEVLAIVRDITSQKQARIALERANDMLEQRVKERTNALAKTNEALLEEISDRIHAEQTLEHRLRYEEGLALCSQSLLKHNDIIQALDLAVSGLLEASDTSRAYIYKNTLENNLLYMEYMFHKNIDTITSDRPIDDIRKLPYRERFSRWATLLSENKPVYGLISDYPAREKEFLQNLKIKSLLILPIFIENVWWGFIGFEDIDKERIWSKNDIKLLKLAAEMIGGYLDKKYAEDALMVSEKRYRTLVENAHDIIFSVKPDGTFSYISPQFKESTGYNVHEFIGRSMENLIHPDDLHEFNLSHSADKSHEYTYRIKNKHGDWRWFISHTTVLYDENGKLLDRIGIAHDVTELKTVMSNLEKTNQELHKTQAQLVQSEKMGALGLLVAGIAHEINTPVGAINSMHNTLVRAVKRLNQELHSKHPNLFEQNKEIKKSLTIIDDANRVIESGTDRVTGIIKRLRSFARLDEAELKDANIHEGIDDTLVIIHHEIKHDIGIVKEFGDLPIISCFPGKLNQVFLNVMINARQAITGKGEIKIKTFTQKNNVVIQISDTGRGIAPAHIEKIFDPGFTTKGVGVGTGLGLSICYQIIQDHHGTIAAESKLGKGTTFTITLPANLDQILNESKTKKE